MTRIRISLLPAELRKQSSALKRWTLVALIFTILALVLLAGNLLFRFYLLTPVMELESLKNQNKSMTENIGRLSYIQEMFDGIEENNRIIASLKGVDPDWVYVIEQSAGNLAAYGINISRMEINAVGETPGSLIQCRTGDVANIAGWLETTGDNDALMDVSLSDISAAAGTGGRLEFHFDAYITIARWNMK
ncbi:MAG: hypothetical protein JXB33_08320 [Clostridia bacterium]|nr:hypothetical protein [Clostridia bacterium]